MEPFKIHIDVEVGLKQTTIDTLRQIFGAQIIPGKEIPTPEIPAEPTPTPAPAPTPEPEKPQTTGADPEGTGAEYDDDDLPPSDAPAPVKKTPTEDDARKAVKAARDRGVSAKTIKELMKTGFDIAASVECPAERRQELIDALNRLAA